MGRKQKLGKTRLDKFYYLAKEQGYRSRAAFKLIQLNRKYNFLGNARACIDLCAAPGGWLQVAAKYMPVSSLIIGVDLVPIKPIRNVITFTDDITSASCRARLREELKEYNADVVMHDGAPNVGTEWAKDAYSQAELTLCALKLATQFLGPNGTFVTKVFRSADYNSLLWAFQQLFKKVEATKPQASLRSVLRRLTHNSGYLAPKKIDPKLLDPRHVFVQVAPTVLTSTKQLDQSLTSRKREGYDDNNPTLFRKTSVAEFIRAVDPVKMLLDYNVFEFDEASKDYENHPLTDDTIAGFCADLKLLAKADFRKLLKWRLKMREVEQIRAKLAEKSEAKPVEEESEDARLARELDEISARAKQKKRAAQRKLRKKRSKQQQRLALKMDGGQDIVENNEPAPLFSLSSIKTSSALQQVAPESGVAVDDVDMDSEASSDDQEDEDTEDDEDMDEETRYKRQLETVLDQMYKQYIAKHDKRVVLGELPREVDEDRELKERLGTVSFLSKKEERDLKADNPLLQADRKATAAATSARAAMWFSQPLFAGVEQDDDDDDEEAIQNMADAARGKRAKIKQKGSGSDSEDETDFAVVPVSASSERPASARGKRPRDSGEVDGDSASDSEQGSMDSDSDDLDSDEDATSHIPADLDMRARTLALATEIRNDKRKRDELYDNAFNRYAWNDDDLPAWFEQEEKMHNKPQVPVTKELVEQYKAKFAAIDARPIKKVIEAQARKKARASRVIERAKAAAGRIADDPELTEGAKSRAIEKLYAKAGARAAKRQQVQVVVSNKGGPTQQKKKGAKVKLVDKRQKKDSRNIKKRGKSGTAPKGSIKKRAKAARMNSRKN